MNIFQQINELVNTGGAQDFIQMDQNDPNVRRLNAIRLRIAQLQEEAARINKKITSDMTRKMSTQQRAQMNQRQQPQQQQQNTQTQNVQIPNISVPNGNYEMLGGGNR